MAKQVGQSSDGFLERWLWRCGERPLRAFGMLWAILFGLSLIPLVLGFQHEKIGTGPPRLDGVPYRDFIAGGSQVWKPGDELRLRADELPEFKARQPYVSFDLRRKPETDQTRLMAASCEARGLSGRPWPSLCWASSSFWDVSDPNAPFVPASDPLATNLYWHPQQFQVNVFTNSGTRAFTASFLLPGILIQLAFPQIFSALIVAPLGLLYQRRLRARLRRCCCLQCGHQLDPSKSVGVCPECGSMNNPGDLKNRRSLRRWIFRGVCAVLIVAWLIAQFAARTDGLEHQFEDQLQRLSDVTTAGKARVHSRVDGYGWPINTFFVQTDHWFAVWPGQPPQPVRASRQSGLSSDQSYVYFTYIHRDPTVNTLFTIIWPQIVLQIGLLIAVIAGIGVLFHAIESIVNTIQARRLRRRVATQS